MTTYNRTTPSGASIDVYDVLVAFQVTHPAIAHAIKKLLAAGQRGGGKPAGQDIAEAIQALQRWQEMQKPSDTCASKCAPSEACRVAGCFRACEAQSAGQFIICHIGERAVA